MDMLRLWITYRSSVNLPPEKQNYIYIGSSGSYHQQVYQPNTQELYSFTQLDRIMLVCEHLNEKAQDNPAGENVILSITFVVLQT
jgi:hypothetical protein